MIKISSSSYIIVNKNSAHPNYIMQTYLLALLLYQLVALLRECIMIHDNVFTLPNFYTVADVQCIISYVCSSG